MRRILMATAAAAALMAAGPAWAGSSDGDDDELAPVPQPQTTFKLRRYAFDTMGRSVAEMTALSCLGGQPGIVRARHTAGDVAAAVFTVGLYTPVHVTVECPTSALP
jgi:hypothetical protein